MILHSHAELSCIGRMDHRHAHSLSGLQHHVAVEGEEGHLWNMVSTRVGRSFKPAFLLRKMILLLDQRSAGRVLVATLHQVSMRTTALAKFLISLRSLRCLCEIHQPADELLRRRC